LKWGPLRFPTDPLGARQRAKAPSNPVPVAPRSPADYLLLPLREKVPEGGMRGSFRSAAKASETKAYHFDMFIA
jgi:hypothetical protein